MKSLLLVIALCCATIASAQIRIIPQDEVRRATNIEVADSKLQFQPSPLNFGTIDEMLSVWQGSAVLVNTGTETIAITQIKTTCGCLKAELPKRVLAPKERIKVALKYYPRGHAGRVRQRVLLYSNLSSDKPSAILSFEGLVTASQDRSDDYPYLRGTLRLRQERVAIGGDEREVVRVACMNGGSARLKPTVDSRFLPKGVNVRFEPVELAPKQEGDMVVEYTPQGENGGAKSIKLYINGLNVAPRESAIEIIIGKAEDKR